MAKLELKAELREIGKKGDTKQARRDGKVPAVVYGFDMANTNILLDAKKAEAVFTAAGMSSLIELTIADKPPVKVLIKESQFDPVSDKLIHLDLYRLDLSKPIEVEIPVNFVGETPVVKLQGGVLVYGLSSVHIKCLPENLIHEVKIELSQIQSYNDIIHVSSIKLPDGIELLTDIEQVIASVKPPKVEEVATETVEAEPAEAAKEDDNKKDSESK